MFQLKSRLHKAGISHVPLAGEEHTPSFTPVDDTGDFAEDLDLSNEDSVPDALEPMTDIPQPSQAANRAAPPTKLKAKLTRSWTHNEQLFGCCCGIIISSATLFVSEGVTGAKVFLKATFLPEYPGAIPSYIFWDNNCSLLKHLLSSGDHYFDNVGLPVDVFHFNCKHSEGDIFCQIHCNPARFRELVGADSKWVFNSSAAEQANAWFVKYQNIVQDMPVLKYNFYLDEMIAIHNEQIAAQLAREGNAPHLQTEELLRRGFPFVKSDYLAAQDYDNTFEGIRAQTREMVMKVPGGGTGEFAEGDGVARQVGDKGNTPVWSYGCHSVPSPILDWHEKYSKF
ncbi:hypothetical protein C8R43DRAFT_1120731 [Mycena crocata]|nr:hypothetical protein C8R43DRAFT_1120731 [Mycena crocata]